MSHAAADVGRLPERDDGKADSLEDRGQQAIRRDIINAKITQLLPNKADWKASAGPVARGTLLGFFLGILPGGGAVVRA